MTSFTYSGNESWRLAKLNGLKKVRVTKHADERFFVESDLTKSFQTFKPIILTQTVQNMSDDYLNVHFCLRFLD